MQVISSRPFMRLAVAGALVAALALAGCGRKGPLDPPPSASAAPATEQAPPSAQGPGLMGPASISPFGGGGSSSANSDGAPAAQAAPAPQNKKFLLDPLLN